MLINKKIESFVRSWKKNPEVQGILLTGSYVVGLQTEESDVDIRIVLGNNKKEFSFKGGQDVNDLSISYLARAECNILKKMNDEYFNTSKFEARLFHIGEILYQKNQCITRIKSIAKFYYDQPKRKKIVSKNDDKMKMYSLYSRYCYLINSDANSPFFLLNYYLFMQSALLLNSEYWNVETFILETKLERILTDNSYIENYNLEEYPDKDFLNLWIYSLKKENINHENVKLIYNYFKNNLYDFNEKNFVGAWKESI